MVVGDRGEFTCTIVNSTRAVNRHGAPTCARRNNWLIFIFVPGQTLRLIGGHERIFFYTPLEIRPCETGLSWSNTILVDLIEAAGQQILHSTTVWWMP